VTNYDDVTTHAVLAIQEVLGETAKQRILAKFHHTGLDGADVADILDILDNGDALLELREPFYEEGGADEARRLLGWPNPEGGPDDYRTRLQSRLIGFAVLALALLDGVIPGPQPVAGLAAIAAAEAESRWPGGRYGT
jgi:hypothetical protein